MFLSHVGNILFSVHVSVSIVIGKAEVATPSFEAFVVVFRGTRRLGSDSDMRKLTEVSLASAINVGAMVTIVTHTSFPDMKVLQKIQNKFDHVRLAVYSDDVVGFNSYNWVQLVESFKIAHLRQNRFKDLLYIELDMMLS